ncbi:uncharacterized protein MEPE_04302 [Melanopsichium pennsylvanicum]|uniref:GYF domain-containing protein n=2 Tax=Melanopsichium pennsylvanicum TaxID=63383 RepID=A0AAJ4XNV9_9BASI|nr:gyf domain containing protein [Melanopsichium pennsylvanicum 4]SNX85593.1 uncharacterized protein MEPE_04302 [Melanopsichium pennsylvanicum]
MATSMQFGPEWMRKGPTSKSGGKESASAPPSAAISPGTGPVSGTATAPSAGNGAGKRNGGPGGFANLSGPTPVVSPAVSSPGAFSFAAAAAASTAQNADRNGTHSSNHGLGVGDSDASAALLNGNSAALAKDKISREKLLSLYSSDRTSKIPNVEPSPIDAAPPAGSLGPERSTSTSRRKGGSDRRPSAFSESGAVSGGPLSPGLTGNEPRGLNARSTSGSSAGGFGSAGTSNWDKVEKERPGLFQRASSGALAGVNITSGSRPLSPSVSRDRFSGIQGGVLSGVAPPARKRMDSSDGGAGSIEPSRTGRSIKGSQDENGASQTPNGAGGMGSWGRSVQSGISQSGSIGGAVGAFSDAFSSNRARGRTASAAAENVTSPPVAVAASVAASATQSHEPSAPIVPSGNPEGLSISARFARHKDRLPGEGPIGPPSDGSIGFGKSSVFDRRRERQISQAKPLQSLAARGDASTGSVGTALSEATSTEVAATSTQGSQRQNAVGGEHGPSPDDPDLAQHASAVFGSLKLDEDDSPGLPSASALAVEEHPTDRPANNTDAFLRGSDSRQDFDHQHQNHNAQSPMQAAPWSPETSMWLYRDMAGNVQGPFSSLMMQDWYSQQYFADDLLVKRQEDADFKPLAQIVAVIGNAIQPFVIPPSNWLHSPTPPRSAFDSNLGGEQQPQQSRFSDAFDAKRSWSGQTGRQQGWPTPLALGGVGNVGPSPASPFGRPDLFSAGQGGLRNQDDLMSIIREREIKEQRQAAAAAAASRGPGGMSLGQLEGFGGGLGRSGWAAESAMSPSHWGGIGHAALGQFGDVGLGGHQSPLVGDRPGFDNFGQQQRQAFEQSGSPWTNKASLASRSQFDAVRPMQGQWGEQQAPWNFSATTPDLNNRQMDFSEAVLRNEAIKVADPIGTPRRAQSPAPQHDLGSAKQQVAEQKDEQHKSFEHVFPAPTRREETHKFVVSSSSAPDSASASFEQDKTASEQKVESGPEAARTATPQKKASKRESQRAAAAAAAQHETAQPARPASPEIPPPEAFTTGEPRPEELWPQSPKAVEFAPEPELSGIPALTLSKKQSKREQRSALQRQASECRNLAGSGEPAKAARPTGASNVRVVSQEQFRRNRDNENTSTATQAPLSDWLNDGASPGSPAPASRAPWAAKEDAAQSTGPSLREIQQMEAKRAEAKRAAEKAAARARLAASPSATEELPTTLSWGLASAPATKSVNNATSGSDVNGAAAAPAWNAGKAAPKKTLMEIQEEERKRAEKLKAQQNAQAIAARKGYADSASRSASASNLHGAVVAPASTASSGGGGAWSVVGASGKPTTPSGTPGAKEPIAAASPLATRPSLATASSTPRSTSSTVVPSSSTSSTWSVVGTKPTSSSINPASPSPASRVVSTSAQPTALSTKTRTLDPNAPSPEFIKYCKDNLQGLTIKTDDFIDMLLQFPLDPSADVIEIIADTVYANSSTLDGRRFANDFVSKRKLDVQGRTGNVSGGGVSRWGTVANGSGGGMMGNFGAEVKTSAAAASASPFGAKLIGTSSAAAAAAVAMASGKPGAAQDTGFRVVKGKGAKKRT